ncbi:PAS domain-containing sensor histidine kinase [Ramlibacter humi]|nr:PAS domain-containing sensor histidine kinase [Ramlibacter humi]
MRIAFAHNLRRALTWRRPRPDIYRSGEDMFKLLADNIAQLAWIAEPDGRMSWYNKRWLEFSGTTQEQMRKLGWEHVHHPDHLDRVRQKVQRHLQTGEPWKDLVAQRRSDGVYRWFLSHAFPLRDETGRILKWFGTNTDITEQLALEEELRASDRRKSEFISVLAHELRNPMAPLWNSLEILQRFPAQDEKQVRALAVAERQVRHMAKLLDDLLDISRVGTGKLHIEREPCDAAGIASQVVGDFAGVFATRGVALEGTGLDRPCRVLGDASRITQALSNLLSNAVKFTPKGGRVRVRVGRSEGQVEIAVSDSGRGIAAEMLPTLFQPFRTHMDRESLKEGGLGLGLPLVKHLVEAQGGTVEARSEGCGRGAEFILRLPAAAPGGQAAEPARPLPAYASAEI